MLQNGAVSFVRRAALRPRQRIHWTGLNKALMTVMTETIGEHHAFEAKHVGTSVELRVQVHDGVLQVTVPDEKLTASSADLFIVWLVGSAFVLGWARAPIPWLVRPTPEET